MGRPVFAWEERQLCWHSTSDHAAASARSVARRERRGGAPDNLITERSEFCSAQLSKTNVRQIGPDPAYLRSDRRRQAYIRRWIK
jgi:hypothetical protein